ncbi:MAG: 30S ribosomal protein S17 [Candidatus Micrarchaeia archaeon]
MTDVGKRPFSKRGFIVRGVVVSDRAKRTCTVQRDLVTYVPKYKRYARKISKIAAHNPDEIGARVGDVVEIAECRRISKTKAWIVTSIVQRGQGHIMPGQVKVRDEDQKMHRRKHGGESERSAKQHKQAANSEQESEELPKRDVHKKVHEAKAQKKTEEENVE